MFSTLREAPPVTRRLRALAFDPSLATRLETYAINQITLEVRWEDVLPGPIGEYLEVVDFDPASGVFYQPVNLHSPYLLGQDGLTPSESNPQFHQQMVYAVAMTTIRQFERALGRVAFWSDHRFECADGRLDEQFVRRLRLYPHALRARNAYYSPAKKAILFGYFPNSRVDGHSAPGTLVFTCLSHDIIAHEVTHALLDGVHPRFAEATNPDVRAFHEAFADIVALFQHFSYPSVLKNQISRNRGRLESENLLSQLAQQFGRATGRGAALRDALGAVNDITGVWEPSKPDPLKLRNTFSPHARGSILVAAVFKAFLSLYRSRVADLFRIASNGTGVLPDGDMHPDLTNRLAREAAECADRILQMCIRAIDYCPPMDITFGDFLRGIVTADVDTAPTDDPSHRIAFIESFREWGIHPRGLTSLGLDELVWPSGDEKLASLATKNKLKRSYSFNDEAARQRGIKENRGALKHFLRRLQVDWNLESDRFEVWKSMGKISAALHQWLREGGDSVGSDYARLFGLVIHDEEAPPSVYRRTYEQGPEPTIEIHSVRPAIRRTPYGSPRTHLVVEITQRRRGYFDPEKQKGIDSGNLSVEEPDFKYRAGCTILIDPSTQEVRRIMTTSGDIADNERLERIRKFLVGESGDIAGNAFDSGVAIPISAGDSAREPFAFLHALGEES